MDGQEVEVGVKAGKDALAVSAAVPMKIETKIA
jgi:hypothetical protein